MLLTEFLTLLWSRRGLFVLVCALVIAATAAIATLWPRNYVATTSLMIDGGRARESLVDSPSAAALSPGFLSTQVDVIRSQRVALAAVRMLGIERSEVAQRIFQQATGGRGSMEQFFAERLIDRVRIQPSQNSTVIEISLRAPDARFAADAANAVARAYIATQLDLKVQPAKEFATFYEAQSKAVRERFEAAQRKLSKYQRSNGIVSVDERLDVESQRLNELSTQFTTLQAIRSESAEKAQSAARMSDGGQVLPDVLNNAVVSQLKSEIARTQARMSELTSQFGPRYPSVERLRDELATLESELRRHIDSVTNSLKRQHEVNLARESELRGALASQREKVMSLKLQRDEVAVLMRDVETAQRAMDTLSQRLLQSSVESESRGANVVQLDPAVEPLQPATPNLLMVWLVGLLLAPMAGIVVATIASALDRRVLTTADLQRAMGCPTLAQVPRSRAVRRAHRAARPRLSGRLFPRLPLIGGRTRA
ncbi:MAG: GNVR domain-containing protein [Burkholderiales bacterium]|jgi:chain length determinant protein EpsF